MKHVDAKPHDSGEVVLLDADKSQPNLLQYKITLRSGAKWVREAWTENPRAQERTILSVVQEFAKLGRKREGYLQPEIPKSIRLCFRKAAEGKVGGDRSKLLRSYLNRWIDLETGKRRKVKDHPTKLRKPHKWHEFAEHGRQLVGEARKDGTLVGYTFDAKDLRTRTSIEQLARGMNLTVGEFFSALMERIGAEFVLPPQSQPVENGKSDGD